MFLYLTHDAAQITKSGGRFELTDILTGDKKSIPIGTVEGIIIFGKIQLTTDVIRECLSRRIPVFFLSKFGKYFGKLESLDFTNVELLYHHARASLDPDISLQYAKRFVKSKISNNRVMIMRRSRKYSIYPIVDYVKDLDNAFYEVEKATTKEQLRGIEGRSSKRYFRGFAACLAKPLSFGSRKRRPPIDPANSMLSLGYTFLAQTIQMMLDIQGISSQIGFLHTPKDIKALLVLDVMDMYRSWIVDDMIVRISHTGKYIPGHFYYADNGACLFTDEGLDLFIRSYYMTVFKKNSSLDGNQFVRLNKIEQDIRKLKKSLVNQSHDYEGFRIK